MFTNQAQALGVLREYLPEDAVDALSFLSQCNAPLDHRGPVKIALTSPTGADETYAPLALYNYAGGGTPVNGIPQVGTALYIGAGNIVLNGGGVVSIGPNNVGVAGVRIWNNSGGIIPAFGVLRIVGRKYLPVVTPTGIQNILHVEVAKPNGTFYREYLVNGASPIAALGTGYAFPLGVCTALYNTASTPALGQEWGATNGQWYLSQHRPGFYVYDIVSSTAGTLLASQQRVDTIHGVLDGDITSGGTQDVSIYVGAGGSETDLTINLTARSYIAGSTISSTKRVVVTWINGTPYVTQAQC